MRDERGRPGGGARTEEEQLRRELQRWKRLFGVTLVALVVCIAYFSWLGWEFGRRLDRMEAGLATERSLVVAERCLETLRVCTESGTTATRLLWGVIRPVELETLPLTEESTAPGGAAARVPGEAGARPDETAAESPPRETP